LAWLTVSEAAETLEISEAAVRKRMQRGTLPHRKRLDGRVYTYLDTVTDSIGPPSEPQDTSVWGIFWDGLVGVVRRGIDFFIGHSTLVFSLLYGYVTVLGIFYSFLLYRKFGINIFDYAEIGDFLLAAFKSPSTLFGGGSLVLGLAAVAFIAPPIRRMASGEELGWFRISALINTGIFLINIPLAILLIYVSVNGAAQSIKADNSPELEVQYHSYSGSTEQVIERDLRLIGATQKVVFFYDLKDNPKEEDSHTLVVPQTQIVSMEVPD